MKQVMFKWEQNDGNINNSTNTYGKCIIHLKHSNTKHSLLEIVITKFSEARSLCIM